MLTPLARNPFVFEECECATLIDLTPCVLLKLGRPAQKPYSGKLMLRVPPEVHARAAMMAEASGKSLNTWAAEVLAQHAN